MQHNVENHKNLSRRQNNVYCTMCVRDRVLQKPSHALAKLSNAHRQYSNASLQLIPNHGANVGEIDPRSRARPFIFVVNY